jgi:eight-cysteine-cluster-containing protein
MPKSKKPEEKLHIFVIITLFFLVAFALMALIVTFLPENPPESPPSTDLGGFCGTSSLASCTVEADCVAGGCSGQLCYGKSEPPKATTCEWTECYDAQKYGVSCGCVAQKCAWTK